MTKADEAGQVNQQSQKEKQTVKIKEEIKPTATEKDKTRRRKDKDLEKKTQKTLNPHSNKISFDIYSNIAVFSL